MQWTSLNHGFSVAQELSLFLYEIAMGQLLFLFHEKVTIGNMLRASNSTFFDVIFLEFATPCVGELEILLNQRFEKWRLIASCIS